MILQDSVLIEAAAPKIFSFFEDMAGNYMVWHPDHRRFEWRAGQGLEPGSVAYFEEFIAGELLKKTVTFVDVERDRYISFVPTNRLMRLFLPLFWFEFRQREIGTEFIAGIRMRIGPLAVRLNRRQLEAVRQHMAEEGQNLKRLMES